MELTRFCDQCGATIPRSDSRFCPSCGTNITVTEQTGLQTPLPTAEHPSSKPNLVWKIVWIVLSLLIPFSGLVIGLFYICKATRRRYGGLLLALGVISIIMWSGLIANSSDSTGSANPQPRPTITVEEIKIQAERISYDPLHRDIEEHIGKIVHFRGSVVQVIHKYNDKYDLRLAMGGDYDHIVYTHYKGDRLLENDSVEVWGRVQGLHSYRAIFGNEITLPEIQSLVLVNENK